MTTEAELVLMSLTVEEIDDASRWLGVLLTQWEAHIEATQDPDGRPIPGTAFGNGTDGPIHLIRAIDLAIVRERAQRGGAVPWYAGMPIADHPARTYLDYYQQRIALNPDVGRKPRLSVAGIVEKVCPGCSQAKPLTVAFWGWLGHGLDDHCRACRDPGPATAIRAELIRSEEAAIRPDPSPEPFTEADVADVDDALASL